MYKDKAKQREVNREYQRRKRQGVTKGVTLAEGVTAGSNKLAPGLDLIDKLVDPAWRGRLEKICQSFEQSHNPSYKEDVWLGDYNLSTVCDYLECTR